MLAQLALPAQGYLPTTYRAFAPLAMAPSINLPNVQIEHPRYQVTEGANLIINIRLSVVATTPVTVKYATYLVSASSNDLQVVTNTLTFNSGETTKQITIATLQDSLIEQHEQFNLGLSEVIGATYGRTGPTIVTLIDDDANTQLSPSIPSSTVTAFQTYDWALNVYPEADSVPINIGQSQPVRFNIQAERQGLGMVQYRVVGSLAVANSGNVAAEIDTASLEIHYRLGTTQTYTMGADLVIDPLALTIAAGTNRTFPFSTTFVFATANGSAPSNLSYLAIVANVRAVDQAGPPRTPWSATRTLATTLPAPTIRGATITLQSNSVVEPSTLATIASTPANYQTSSSVSYQHSANVTRVQNGQAMVVHTVSIPETGLSILAETPLQASSATNEATLEFLDLEPRAATTVDAIPFTATLRVYDGINLNPAGINLVETDALSTPIRTLAQFRDDGLNGDVLANDGIFIARGTTTWTTAGQKSLVVQAQQVFGQPLLIATPGIEVVAKRPDAEWNIFFDTLDAAGAQFEQLKSRLTIVEAQFELLNWLENQPGVAQVRLIDQRRIEIDYDSGLSNSIWVEDPENATLGAGGMPSPNTSLTSSIEPEPIADRMLPVANTAPIFTNSNRAIILNSLPSGNTVANTSVPNVRAYLQAAGFTVEVYQQADARIPLYKQLDQYGVIHTIGHGYYTGVANRYTITTGHLATVAAQSEYRADIDAKNISVDIKDGKTLLNTTIRFYQTYYKGKTFPNSLWSLIHCDSAEETDLSSLLIGKGVKGYVGFDGLIPNDPGWTWGADGPNSLYKMMGKQGFDLGTAFNSIPANQKEIVYNLLTPVVGTTTQHTYLRLAAGSSENLKLSSHGFTNGNFEAGSLLGWSHRTGVWANAFAVPSWAQPNHGLYAGHIGKMIYPPECGTCNPIPMTNELFQYVDLLSSTKFLRFDYAYSTYLPSNGWIEVSLQSPSNGAILATYRLAQYPGSGTRGASDFWYTDIRSSKIDIRTALNQTGFKGQSIRVNFRNIQQNGNAQTFYLDNVRIADF